LSIVFDLERTNQLNLLPDKDLVDLCPPIEPYQVLSSQDRTRIMAKIEAMKDDLQGDVKQLKNFTPNYRLRVGNYRILFEVEEITLVIYRVKHRQNIYN